MDKRNGLDRFPFKINPMVENMHSTAIAHGSSGTEEDFHPSHHLFDFAYMTWTVDNAKFNVTININ